MGQHLACGIIGLPNVGKSTLFNSLLKKRVALSANYPFATIEPNTGVVAVPDERLLKLAILTAKEEGMIPKEIDSLAALQNDKYKLPPIVPAVVEFVDIAGLVKGASTGAGLGNQFLSHIREVDAIIHVLRDFDDPSTGSGQVPIIREGSVDPVTDREVIETELQLADLQVLEKLIQGQDKQFRISKDALDSEKLEILNSLKSELDQGHVIGNYHVGDERLKAWFNTLPLLSTKPILYVFNVSESEYKLKLERQIVHGFESVNENCLIISAKIEEELVDLSDEEKTEYLSELGIKEPGLERLIKKAYQVLGLISFLTAGKKEVRAWTIKKGTKAPDAAGTIHTDFTKGFIRAQVIEYEKLIEAGSLKSAREKGWVRTEGKEYIVKDGDVVEFLINT